MKIIDFFRRKWQAFDQMNRSKAAEMYENELKELQNIFAVLVNSQLMGIPAPPAFIAFELLPYMEQDIKIMFERMDVSHDPLAELFSIFDVG